MTALAPMPVGRPRRVVYLGTPQMAVPPLQALVAAGIDVACVVTRPDARRGRGSATTPSPVKAAALDLGLPVVHTVDEVLTLDPPVDLGVVVAFGQIIRPHVLAVVPMVNLHFSLLPRWRGAAPVERALLAGDPVTGVCVMQVEEGLDTGGVFARAEVPIGDDTTADDLRAQLVAVGTDLLVDAVTHGFGAPEPQEGEPVVARKISPDDLRLDWRRPAIELHRQIRVGGAWTVLGERRLKVHAARPVTAPLVDAVHGPITPGRLVDDVVVTGDGGLRLVTVQPEGRGPLPWADFARGARLAPDTVLGLP